MSPALTSTSTSPKSYLVLKRLIIITGLVLVTILFVNFINTKQHTAIFNACPNTDYCSDLGRAQQSSPVHITYSGWPFKVKAGNPDWCAQGVCEGNNFHDNYHWEFFAYNAVILSMPTAIVIAAYLNQRNRHFAQKLFLSVSIVIISLILGWFTMFIVRSTVVWQTASKEPGASVKSGVPFPSTLALGYECNASSCARTLFRQDTEFFHSEPQVYANWIFWSAAWGVTSWFILRNYAHSRH